VFADLLASAAQNTVKAAERLARMLRDFSGAMLAREIVEHERRRDRTTHELIRLSNTTFANPVDREMAGTRATAG